MKYYKITITKTSKAIGSKENYSQFDFETIEFNTIQKVKDYLVENYPKCKKVKMYRDKKDGTSYQAGLIYCFKNSDISHDSKAWYQQDWIEVLEVEAKTILI